MTVLANANAGQEDHRVNEGPCGPKWLVIKTVLKITRGNTPVTYA